MMRLDQLVAPWADRTPHQIAVDGDEVLTYAELDQLANRFSHCLRALGVRPGDRVGIHTQRSGRAVAAMVGALRVGAAYVPLDPGSPPSRIRIIARDCGLRHVVISPGLLQRWLAGGACDPVEHFLVSSGTDPIDITQRARVHPWSEIEASSPSAPGPTSGLPDDLAYILYTSGSTGIPKGVMLSHKNALSFVRWATDAIALSPADLVASVAPFHFDLSVFDVWGSLARGATLVIVDETAVLSGRRMLERIAAKAISVWYSVPSALVLMLESGLADRAMDSLRVVYFAGEVFPMRHLRRLMMSLSHVRFFNLFGPTETNVCLAHELASVPSPDASAIPIGRPVCENAISIRNPDGTEVAEGQVGELFVDGPTVMLGYWGDTPLVPGRPFATGDLVSRRTDGELMYHGRGDQLVKIHGHRVELGEVEAAVLGHPGIDEVMVLAVDQKVVVVAVPSDPSVSVLDIKRHCAAALPRYMIPGEVRLVRELARTSTGKVDWVRIRAAVLADDSSVLKSAPRVVVRPGTKCSHG
jgi:amino acid adenylation domain-containing protein